MYVFAFYLMLAECNLSLSCGGMHINIKNMNIKGAKEMLNETLSGKVVLSFNGDITIVEKLNANDLLDVMLNYAKQFRPYNVSFATAINYAEFCIKCDREKLPPLNIESYIQQYCN